MFTTQQLPGETQPMTKVVLIVEDDVQIGLFLVQAIQEEIHHQVMLATDGFQALDCIKHMTPQLFLLDQQLPNMSGLELYDYFQTIDELKNVPALFMSANPPVQELKKRHLHYLKKPFELDELLQIVEAFLAD